MAKIIDLDIVLPLIVEQVQPNTVEVGTPVVTYTSSNAIEVETAFSSDVDYVGGISINETDITYIDNPQYISKRFTGLTPATKYTFNGVGLAVMGQKTYGPLIEAWTSASPIPTEYQLVEWLQSTGTQYIQINGNIDNNYGYEAEYSIGQYGDKYPCGLVGGTGRLFGWGSITATQLTYGWGSVTTAYSNGLETVTSSFWSLDNYGIYSLNLLNSKKAVRRGVSFDISNPADMFTSSGITIFGSSVSKIACRIKWWKFSHNVEIAYSLYPVYRKSDNKPGMYDIINNVFYTNVGTGEFIVGPDKEWDE